MHLLEIQYRMHPAIAAYPSKRFYQGKLLTCSTIALGVDSKSHTADSESHHTGLFQTHDKVYHRDLSRRFLPFVFHDIESGVQVSDGTSFTNLQEVSWCIESMCINALISITIYLMFVTLFYSRPNTL